MKRLLTLLYGLFCYSGFLAIFLYAIGFVGNFGVPKTIDGTATLPWGNAILVNVSLVALFGLQHSIMARPWFKQWWTQFVPEPIERSTYVLFTNVIFVLLFYFWQPIGLVIWNVESLAGKTACYALFATGWITVLITTFLINHFDLFGLRQVWLFFRGREYTPLGFVAPGPYRYVRHPMYIGWMLAFWATPNMTVAHFAFAVAITAYILTAIYFEERDLVESLGQDYADYRRNVPMLVPRLASHPVQERLPATVPAGVNGTEQRLSTVQQRVG